MLIYSTSQFLIFKTFIEKASSKKISVKLWLENNKQENYKTKKNK